MFLRVAFFLWAVVCLPLIAEEGAPKPRPKTEAVGVDFNGKKFLFYGLTDNGKTPTKETMTGITERPLAYLINWGIYENETRPEVKKLLNTGSSIRTTFFALILEPTSVPGKLKLSIICPPYEIFVAIIDQQKLELGKPYQVTVPKMGGASEMGEGYLTATLDLIWNKKTRALDVNKAKGTFTLKLKDSDPTEYVSEFGYLKGELQEPPLAYRGFSLPEMTQLPQPEKKSASNLRVK